jgi:DNA-binding CsgD family transcriptional regulator
MYEAVLRISPSNLADLGLRTILEGPSSATIDYLTEIVTHGSGGILLLEVEEPIPPTALDTTHTVVWWEQVMTEGAGAEYLCNVQVQGREGSGSLLAGVSDKSESDETQADINVSVIGPRDRLQKSLTLGRSGDRRTSGRYLDRLINSSTDHTPLSRLTERQRQVLQLAYEMGYYEVPRTASSADIATRVSLDPSTVAEHLQRAERNLLKGLLG